MKIEWRRIHWVNALFLCGTFLGALLLTPLYLSTVGWHWGLFSLFVVYAFLTNLAITAGYHRYLAHRSYDAKPLVKLGYLLVGAAAFQGSALQWVADHRRHHRFADTERDPHNIRKGFFWAHVGWLLIKEPPEASSPLPPDMLKDRWVMWQHRHFVPIAVVMGGLLPTLIGWAFGYPFGGFVFGGVLRVFVTNHCTFFINSLAHCVGKRPYSSDQTARDSLLMAFLACGEGYHNYHHQFAADYRNGVRWYHWDPTKWFIKGLSWLGLTYRLRKVPPTEILRAQLRNEQRWLVAKGIPAERVQALKQAVEDAQARWRKLRDDYQSLKRNMQCQSQRRMLELKADAKKAHQDFKHACRQWGLYKKAPHAVPAFMAPRNR